MAWRGLCDCQSFVDRAGLTGRGDECGCRAASPRPDHPVLAREDEVRRSKRRAGGGGDQEVVGNAGEDRPGRTSVDADNEWIDPRRRSCTSVDRSVPLSATHHGLVALRARPQPLTRFGSVAAAAPGTSETSRVTAYVPPGGAAGSCAAATSANEATVAKNVMRRIVPRMTHSSSCRVPASPYDEMHGPVHIRCNTSLQPGEGAGPRGCVAAKARRRRSRRWRASSRHHRAGAAEEPHGEHAIDGRETPDATRPWRS